MPSEIQKRVFHRSDLTDAFLHGIREKQNVLIIIDEIQVAAKQGQSLSRAFKNAGLLDIQELYRRDIKILEFTATPDGTIYDLKNWGDASYKILAEPSDKYISAKKLMDANRVKQFKDLYGVNAKLQIFDETVYENIREIKTDIEHSFQMRNTPMYHIIRINRQNAEELHGTMANFKHIFGENEYDYMEYNQKSDTKDINDIISIQPKKHTFIFILEMLRCAKTLIKTYIGIMYERYTKKPDDATIIQGLVGRLTGFDDNGISICYTNIDSIVRYEQLWACNFDSDMITWNSKTTTRSKKNGRIISNHTFNDPVLYSIVTNSADIPDNVTTTLIANSKKRKWTKKQKVAKGDTYTEVCNTFEEAQQFFEKNIKPLHGGSGPHRRKQVNGFYLSTSGKGETRTRIRTIVEIQEFCHWALDDTHHYTFHPGYEDINDPSTVKWLITYIIPK
jgi:hypothetical protein